MGLSIKKIIELSAKIYAVESNANLLPMPDSPEERQKLIENKTIKNYKSFTPEEKQFMQENKSMFSQGQYPKMCEWLKDTSKLLGDEFKSAEPAIKANSEYPLLATLKLYATLSGEAQFFNEKNLKDLHARLGQFIGKDDPNFFQKANKLIEAMSASDAKQPIHDFFIKLNLPAAEKKWDKEKWYDLAVKTSPRALLYLARADEIEAHLGGVPKTLEQAAKALGEIAYPGSKEKIAAMQNLPEGVNLKDLADYTELCVGKGIRPDAHSRGLDVLLGKEFEYQGKPTKIKAKTNIPGVAIEGKDIAAKYGDPELAKYRLEVLKPQDWRMLIMGEITNCCQSIGNHAEKCALEAMTNENCGVVAVFKGDKIVGQSFVWLGQDDNKGQKTFVFDSWERLNPNLNFLCQPFYTEAAAVLQSQHGINKVTLGAGGNVPFSLAFETCQDPIKYRDKESPYEDSAKQNVIIDVANGIDARNNVSKISDTNLIGRLMGVMFENQNNREFDIKKDLQEVVGKISDVNLKPSKTSPMKLLDLAIMKSDEDAVKVLIQRGANLSSAAMTGQNLLQFAISSSDYFFDAKFGNIAIINLLLENGGDVNNIDKSGDTPLLHAVNSKNLEIAKLLIEKGADVNKVDKSGDTPLLCAVNSKNLEMVKLLIEKGADMYKVNKLGRRALEAAKTTPAIKSLIEECMKNEEKSRWQNRIQKTQNGKGISLY